MAMHSLLAVGLIALLSLSTLPAADRLPPGVPPQGTLSTAVFRQQAGGAIAFDDYWKLVRNTRQAITRMQAQPPETIRRQLDALANQWQQLSAVEDPDGSVIQVDSSYLVAQLRGEPPELKRLGHILDALLQAHEEYPQKVFTPDDVRPLKEILAQPEFQWPSKPPQELPNWRKQLNEFLERLALQTATFAFEHSALFRVAAVLLFVLIMLFIARSLSHGLVREAQLAEQAEQDEEVLTSTSAFKRAEALSTQGDYRNAIRFLYLSSLLVLDEHGLLRYDRSRTNREYLRSVSSRPQLAKPLRDVIDVFDRVWYGFEDVDERTYQSYVERVDQLREQKE